MMVKKIKNNVKREKGITLVALVVTIVVLLILAFISISLLTGENGIINKAEESKEETIKAKEREMIQLTYQDLEMEYTLYGTDITADRVWEKLKEYDNNIKVEMKAKEELGETEIVVEKNSGEEYAEITYEETGHKYAGSLLIDENKARYEVTYNANKGYGGPTKQIKIEGMPLTITGEMPERKGYSFKGWSKESTAIVAEYVSGSQYTEDANVTLYAVWQLREDIEPVAQIGDTKYPSIQEAIYDCSEEAGETATTIILLKNTEEEFRTYEGQNIILDLQGYTVTSESTGVLCTNNGKIQIENGELRSNNGISIVNYGEITIGNNSNGIDDNTPTIYGKNVGIENNGVFNFYDGKIQGIIPIQGETTNTPEEYGPVQTGYENGITTVQLRILTQYEARIGWVYYETLQGAVDIAKEKETVSLIKDLQLKETLNVSEDKDIILDLYGYSLTVAPEKATVINNYGDLEITDSSIEQIGKLSITSDENGEEKNVIHTIGICNKGNQTIKIKRGTIETNSIGKYNYAIGIYNENNGNIEITGGIIESTNNNNNYSNTSGNYSNSYAIYNSGNGSIEVNEGIINSNGNGKSNSYGIYNHSSGIIKIIEGTVNTVTTNDGNTSTNNYGVYNNNGVVEIAGGIINSNCNGFGNSYGIFNLKTLKATGGTINSSGESDSDSYGIYNEKNGIVDITKCLVKSECSNLSYARSYGIYNVSSGIIRITEGIINSISSCNNYCYSYGIYNKSSGIIEVEKGTVSSESTVKNDYTYSYGIYNESTGSINIGDKEEISKEKTIIKAQTKASQYSDTRLGFGVYNKDGKVEFYNGLIQGTTLALSGTITRIRESCQIEKDFINEIDSMYLVEIKNTDNYIVQIENIKYTNLQEAINNIDINKQTTIQIIKDFEINGEIEFNKDIILDLNNYTIKNNYFKIFNTGNLKIIDRTENAQGKIECKDTIMAIVNKENGNIEIESGIINIDGSKSNYGIYNEGTGAIKISGGQINTNSSDETSYGIYNLKDGSIKLMDGIINSNAPNGTTYGIYNADTGKIEITGGEINVESDNGYGSSYGISNWNGKIFMSGGTINSYNNVNINGNATGIKNNNDGMVTIVGGTINTNALMTSTGIENWGQVIIEKGNISCISRSYGKVYGIYNFNDAIITVGIKGDELISKEIPNIKAQYNTNSPMYDEGYGIYNLKGSIYYYDGIIQGSTKAIYDVITEIEENTELNYNENQTVLTLTTVISNIAQIGDTTYPSLQEAIKAVGNSETTIKILRNVTYINQDSEIIIPNGKNVILDLNGYRITSAIPNQAIKNEGILKIIDTSITQEGIIISSEKTTIKNIEGAELIIAGGTIENRNTQCIYNEGKLTIMEGRIYNTRNDYGLGYAIYNNNNGYVEISGGTVIGSGKGDKYGIFNNSNGIIKVTGGAVNISGSDDSSYVIYNNSNGIIEITGGTISNSNSNKYGIYNASIGDIIIGTKGDEEVSSNEPYINEINNVNGNLYYYDGKIQGKDNAISGNITEIEDSTEIVINEEAIGSYIYKTITLNQIETNVARVNGVDYDSIQKAVQACGETERTIEILRDSEPGATIIVGENQNITIDLKGHIINNYTELQNKGTLKIVDTSSEQTGKIVGLIGTAILNTGTMTLESGEIADSGYGIQNTGILYINGGNITNNTYGIYNDESGIATIAGGNINSNTYGIYNYATNSTINVDGGNITSNQYAIYNSSGATNISGTGITNNDYGIYNAGGTTNIKEGAEVQSNIGVYNASGRLNIGEQGTMNPDSPVVIGETYGLSVSSTGTVYMYDGQVKGKEGATEGYITYTEEGYVVANREEGEYKVNYLALGGTANAVAQVNGISYSNLQSAINSITGGEEQTITLLNGIIAGEIYEISEGQNIILDMNGKTITTDLEVAIKNSGNLTIVDTSNKNVASITSTTGVGIENSGTLTLGEDDGIENPDLIIIEGATHGITNTGTLNVYDGTIRPE